MGFVKIFDKKIGLNEPVFIIGEVGVNHIGNMNIAQKLIDIGASAKVDAIKFQAYRTERLISADDPYWRERLKPKELSFHDIKKLKERCADKSIPFLCTAHEEESADFLESIGVEVFKIGSGEVANLPFLRYVAKKGKPIILSTGMYTLSDIEKAIKAIVSTGNENIVLLHCVTNYPTKPEEVNLKFINTLTRTFGFPVGYSDHTFGYEIPLAAVSLGAVMLEKHITLDHNMKGSADHQVSCEPDELISMVESIRKVECALGNGIKRLNIAEIENKKIFRKSVVAVRTVKAGDIIKEEDLCLKRPGTGIKPELLSLLVGKVARQDIEKDSLINWEAL